MMRGHALQFGGFLGVALFLSVICNGTHAQTGFVSIDCGSNVTSYKDVNTTLQWVNDDNLTLTGTSVDVPSPVSSNVENYQALQSFRYFPERRNKHCYELPITTSNISFLIRPMFLHGGSSELVLPIEFDVSINATTWFSVQYGTGDSSQVLNRPKVFEGIFYFPGGITYFCLVPVTGVPFISSLELRQLDAAGDMYSSAQFAGYYKYLSSVGRWNCGAEPGSSALRYPDDQFDRLWYASGGTSATGAQDFAGTVNATTISGVNNVPRKVMQDAWRNDTADSSITFDVTANTNFDFPTTRPVVSQDVYAFVYSEDIGPNASSDGRGFVVNISGPGALWDGYSDYDMTDATINSTSHYPQLWDTWFWFLPNETVDFMFTGLPGWQRGPIVNAIEISSRWDFNFSTTATQDVDTLKDLQENFHLTDWQGDPCFPVPWDWLACNTNNDTDIATIIKLLLSGMDINGTIPEVISQFKSLTEINMSNNAINSLPTNWSSRSTIIALDLTSNNIAGVDASFFETSFAQALQKISMAGNVLAGTIPQGFFNLPSLRIGNFDRNGINGTLDLTVWSEALTLALEGKPLTFPSISLVNNSVAQINPRLHLLAPDIGRLLRSTDFQKLDHGILLGGNPWCKGSKTEAQRYLCRFSREDQVTLDLDKTGKQSHVVLIIGSVLGFLVLLFISVGSVVVGSVVSWKLWKQVHDLRELQQALAKQKVQPPFYSYNDLKVATRDFHVENELGKGGFGAVYKGVLGDGTIVAVKKLFNLEQVISDFLNEVVLITGIKHRNLIQLKGCCMKDKQRILVYEYAENKNVAEALWDNQVPNRKTLNWQQRFNICVGVARGLSYLHEELQPGIVHRDIKPANILLDGNYNPKIADFGLARPFLDEETHVQYTQIAGTRGYLAPEYVLQGELTEKADVFSFGILALEIVSGRKCIDYNMPPEQIFLKNWAENMHNDGVLLDLLQPELRQNCKEAEVTRVIDIALICVQMDPVRRATMSQVVTMLLGSMDVSIFLDKSSFIQPDFNTVFDSVVTSSTNQSLAPVLEESFTVSEEHPLIDTGSTSESSKSTIELSDRVSRQKSRKY